MKIRLRKEDKQIKAVEEAASAIPAIPTIDYINSIWGEISVHNIKTLSDGRSWVVNCLTGEVMERKNADPVLHKKNVLWIPKGYQISPVDYPKFFRWKNPDRVTI